ncbi:recombinase family protein [Streptomyces violascens]|uniref:recombinase family protein n=1 Tax=Streptomyces violascens TaxID=67381 RepID=UPI0019C9DA2C|nr:recombinase family protein [Streptomyces violascens]GGU50923.1 hypothetical protein GCM10010289_84200 [Streptomyces violascens]
MWRPGRLAVPDRQGQGGDPVPHRPLPPRAIVGQSPGRADPRKRGAAWTEPLQPAKAGSEPIGHVRLGYARASIARQPRDAPLDSLAEAGVDRVFSEKISTRTTRRPELEAAVKLAEEIRSSGVAVPLVVHEHKQLGRAIELAMLAEQLKADDVGLGLLTGELKGCHDPSGIVITVLAAMSGIEREYIRDRTLEGHESARKRGKTIGGASVTADDMLSTALHLRDQEMSPRDIAKRLVTTGAKKGRHPHLRPSCGGCASTTTRQPRWNPPTDLRLSPSTEPLSARCTYSSTPVHHRDGGGEHRAPPRQIAVAHNAHPSIPLARADVPRSDHGTVRPGGAPHPSCPAWFPTRIGREATTQPLLDRSSVGVIHWTTA